MKCSVSACKNLSNYKRGKSCFRFPKDVILLKKWLEAIRQPEFIPNSRNFICENHFVEADIQRLGKRKNLKNDAVPSRLIDMIDVQMCDQPGLIMEESESLLTSNMEEVSIEVASNTHENFVYGAWPISASYSTVNTGDVIALIPSNHQEQELCDTVQQNLERHLNAESFDVCSRTSEESLHSDIECGSSSHATNSIFVENIKKNFTIKECMETSDESSEELSESNFRRKAKLKKLRGCIRDRDKVINRLRQKIFRQNKKVVKIENLLYELKEKNLIGEDAENTLSQIVGSAKDIFERHFVKNQGKTAPKTYKAPIRAFALNLNFMSPKAYSYVREVFSNCLPHPRTLREWYKVYGCSPGFTKESFIAIKAACEEAGKAKDKLFLNLVFDEIHIRKHIDWDGKRSYGYVDAGDGGLSEIPATQILVLMAVCINRSWKIPIAFFPIASMNSEQKANIIKLSLEELEATGAEIIGITFDGATVNLSAAKLLGCDIRDVNADSSFHHNNEKYIVHPDPCHMIKLVRNALGDLKCIINEEGQAIEWKYLDFLVKLQEREQLHLGNKLKQAHIYFAKKKMNVKLAVQTFSKSVADALDFCREVLQYNEFSGSKPLSQFIRIVNDTFDILNSRRVSTFEYFKRALCNNNSDKVREFAEFAISYFLKLSLPSGELLIYSTRKMGFIGLIACLKNLKTLDERFIKPGKLQYIPLYKINQDHLELFFSSIRSHLGRNNNPSVRQFISAYKKLIVRCQIREGGIGNCIPLESIEILSGTPKKTDPMEQINSTVERLQLIEEKELIDDISVLDQQFLGEHCYAAYPAKLSEYGHHVVSYIAGFVVMKINKGLNCPECLSALQGSYSPSTLLAYKTRGKLQMPSESVIQICKKAECSLRFKMHFLKGHDTILRKDILLRISIEVQNFFINRSLFEDQQAHMGYNSHYSSLIKLITEKYLHTRYYFIAKKASEKISLRQHYNKMVIFQGM